MKKTLIVLALAGLTAGCAKQPAHHEVEVQADAAEAAIKTLWGDPNAKGTFEGIQVPGDALTAKAAGFTECSVTQDFRQEVLECIRPKSKLAGVRAVDAFVRLKPPLADPLASTKLADYKLEQLTYSEVTFRFTPLVVADMCAKEKANPAKAAQVATYCDGAGSQMDLVRALKAQGWVLGNDGDVTDEERYYHADQTVVIASEPFHPLVKVRAVGVEMRDSAIGAAAGEAAKAKAEKDATSALIEGMRSAK